MDDSFISAPSRRWRALLPLAVPVVLAHLALAGVSVSWADTPPPRVPTVAVRVVDAPAPPPAAAPAPASPAPAPTPAPAAPARKVAKAAAKPGVEPQPIVDPAPGDVPVYRTRIPPSLTVRYVISRGPWSGNGELVWDEHDTRYHARLEGRVAGFKVITWDSTGQIDGDGIAPVRFTDERRGKSMLAANFQRSAGKITYSGPDVKHPLIPGTQDRLSWMVQIAAIANADPQRVAPGKRISMFVTGARGDADVWSFQAIGTENVAIGGASVPAIKLLREPRKAHDTRVEVWLDPQLHHLPVRARLTSSPDNETLELVRRGSDPS